MKLMDRLQTQRKSPVYRALQVLPTPARPWLLALEAITQLRLGRKERYHQRKEHHLERQLRSARAHRSGGIGRVLVMGALAFAATKLLDSKKR